MGIGGEVWRDFCAHRTPSNRGAAWSKYAFLSNAEGEFLLDIDFDLEDFDVDALRAATIKTLSESRDIADCSELIERLELQGLTSRSFLLICWHPYCADAINYKRSATNAFVLSNETAIEASENSLGNVRSIKRRIEAVAL